MANTLTPLNPTKWEPVVQDYLNNILVATMVAQTKFRDRLKSGDEIEFPETSDLTVQDYTPGTDLTPSDMVATSSVLTVDQSKSVVVDIDDDEKIQAEADYPLAYSRQMAFRLANQIDRDLISDGVTSAANTGTAGTLTATSIFTEMIAAHTSLFRANATDGRLFAIMGPQHKGLLTQTLYTNGYKEADNALRNGFSGRANEFDVYCSNNIPSSVTLTIANVPSDGETVVIAGVTFTYKTALTPTAGEVLIGANLAAAQANLIAAVNGAAGAGSTYVALSADDRATLSNGNFSMSAFATNVTTITGVGLINGSETLAGSGDDFGTETTNILFGRVGAMSLGMQTQPNLKISDKPLQHGYYYKAHTLYGVKTFSRDTNRLYNLTCNSSV